MKPVTTWVFMGVQLPQTCCGITLQLRKSPGNMDWYMDHHMHKEAINIDFVKCVVSTRNTELFCLHETPSGFRAYTRTEVPNRYALNRNSGLEGGKIRNY